MNKKNVKVKNKDSNISITIENNLNANNKQINHQPIKRRRRRRKKVENSDEINEQNALKELPDLKDTSYIKPGPVGFKVWRDTMDSYNTTTPMNIPFNQAQQLGLVPPPAALPAPPVPPTLPAPPVPPALPAPEQQPVITFDNFARILSMIVDNQRTVRPPPQWSRNLIDADVDDEDNDDNMDINDERNVSPGFVPASPVTSFSQRSATSTPARTEPIIVSQQVPPAVVNDTKRVTQAKRLGTMHANANKAPQGAYQDMPEYQASYMQAMQKRVAALSIIPGEGKTRAQKQKFSIAETLAAGREFREPLETANRNRIILDNEDAEILQNEVDALDLTGDFLKT